MRDPLESKPRKLWLQAPQERPARPFGSGYWRLADANRQRPHRLRRGGQFIFLGICLLIGWQFVRFYDSCVGANQAVASRPAGVEAFLPISALMSVKYWMLTGVIHPVHPAGLLIFAAIVIVSLLFKRSFCSWVCPIGLLSEKLADIGTRMFRRNLRLPRWADVPLRGIKYLFLAFFAYVIFCRMDVAAMQEFLDSPFNEVADVRLLQFFLHPGTTTIVVLTILAAAAIAIRHFWCRYLCPYGALTAVFGMVSPTRIKREIPSCIGCAKCSKACPAGLRVHQLASVRSDECTLCLECVESCPVPDTLGVSPAFSRRRIWPVAVASIIGGIFVFIVIYGRLTGHWQSSVTPDEMKQQIQTFASPQPN